MNILPKKSWHVRNKDNVARVRRDEARAAEEERELQRRVERAEQEARTQFLRNKSRAALQQQGACREDEKAAEGGGIIEHLNLFPLEESTEKKGNEEYLKEKKEEKERQERAIGLLVSLGPPPGTDATPWYMKKQGEQEKPDEKQEKAEQSKKEKDKWRSKTFSEEQRAKKDKRLKDQLDPLRDVKKALAAKEKKEHRSKKKGCRDRANRSGESSLERLRAERLQREAEERRRAQSLIDQRSGKGKEQEREVQERDRPYNSAYFPELARKRRRRDGDQYGFFQP
ncbi:leukocyte receptor cluster member 1 [Denticeps clupeoides]|uniref:CBF1-interacting co-repressor CIR N-terminal domain-containing protein n=1 Tax=Denticeps clupeoides TaxID=299321 RepID=A0AAY4AM59_9TELE|nr:leukocyte receptor cluster member 1 [Denticeps clupeoides]